MTVAMAADLEALPTCLANLFWGRIHAPGEPTNGLLFPEVFARGIDQRKQALGGHMLTQLSNHIPPPRARQPPRPPRPRRLRTP